jgi:tRNA pseudouridine55 synthase
VAETGRGRVLLVDKPAGLTSHDSVAAAKREHHAKAGHAGTLDPFATGLLIVLLGRAATREQARFMNLRKTYRATAQLGATSTTGDTEGEVTVTGNKPPTDLELPIGEIHQRPPAHSAVKVGGERAYRRARRGEQVEMPPRVVTVHRFELLRRTEERAEFEIECSAGTYVRSLISDLPGDAYCVELRRTAIGPFVVDEAASAPLLDLDEALERVVAFERDRVRADG